MADAILTLNAGSSSIKFALFARQAEIPRKPELVGQIDGIGAAGGQAAHLKVKDAAGRVTVDIDIDLDGKAQSPHKAALGLLVDRLRGRRRSCAALYAPSASGHCQSAHEQVPRLPGEVQA